MATFRTLLGLSLLLCAAVIAWLGINYHGYKEEFGSTPLNTLRWAIPWSATTTVLAILVLGALFSRKRRPTWSWWGLGFALVMALALVALWVWA